jgi:DNA-binding FrmR family transcriptional regulator
VAENTKRKGNMVSLGVVANPEKRGPHPVNQRALQRLKKIEGQVRGIQRMVEEEKYCIDILTQISAVRAALKSVGMVILKRHIETCVSGAIEVGGSERSAIIEELMTALSKDNV